MVRPQPAFWTGRRILVTGHTGFKGAWAARWLARLGAQVAGLSLAPSTNPNLHKLLATPLAQSDEANLTNRLTVAQHVAKCRPELVLHMAAQALVPASFRDPVGTWEANVLGTLNLINALCEVPSVRAILVVTSDKVYENRESAVPFCETDRLGGDDPYSASKAATELLVNSWRSSFPKTVSRLATARGGNVIGGGDWAPDRLVPDVVRAIDHGEPVVLRNPSSTRPWQHVLDCVNGYLCYLEALHASRSVPMALNFGPIGDTHLTVSELVERMLDALGARNGWRHVPDAATKEKQSLRLDCGAAVRALGWRPMLEGDATIAWTTEWYAKWRTGASAVDLTDEQIDRFQALPSR